PVTAMTRASGSRRARAAMPMRSSARSGSSTRMSAPSPEARTYSRFTSAAAAPRWNATGTKACPSRSALSATKTSPGTSVRVSMEKPVTGTAAMPSAAPAAAATRSSQRQSGSSSVIRTVSPENGQNGLMVREGQHSVADDLAGVVAFAGHQQDIAGSEHANGGADSLAPVADLARSGSRHHDLG